MVEDNSNVAQVTQSLLEQIGYETIRTDSATEALKLLDSGQKFDLVFSDIVMPGTINGIGLAERIKERHRGIPVLLTTGYSEGLKLAGSNFDVLRKPFVVSTLEAGRAIRDRGQERQGQSERRRGQKAERHRDALAMKIERVAAPVGFRNARLAPPGSEGTGSQ